MMLDGMTGQDGWLKSVSPPGLALHRVRIQVP